MSGLGNFLAALYRVLSWRLLVAGALMLILTLTQGVGLLMLIPLLDLVGIEVSGGSVDLLTDTLSRIFATLRLPPTLAAVLLIYVVIIGLNAYLIQHQAILLHRLEETFVRTLRQQLYGAITEATWPFYIRHKSSDFTHALTSEMQRIRSAARSSLDLAVKLTVALVYVGLALYLSPLVTLLASVCGLGLVALIYPQMRLARRKGGGHHRGQSQPLRRHRRVPGRHEGRQEPRHRGSAPPHLWDVERTDRGRLPRCHPQPGHRQLLV